VDVLLFTPYVVKTERPNMIAITKSKTASNIATNMTPVMTFVAFVFLNSYFIYSMRRDCISIRLGCPCQSFGGIVK
jgi:hypothetical protein